MSIKSERTYERRRYVDVSVRDIRSRYLYVVSCDATPGEIGRGTFVLIPYSDGVLGTSNVFRRNACGVVFRFLPYAYLIASLNVEEFLIAKIGTDVRFFQAQYNFLVRRTY